MHVVELQLHVFRSINLRLQSDPFLSHFVAGMNII
jgi:hypothetical protein